MSYIKGHSLPSPKPVDGLFKIQRALGVSVKLPSNFSMFIETQRHSKSPAAALVAAAMVKDFSSR